MPFVLGLQYGHRFHAFAAAVDPAWRRYSAGTIIFLLVLEDLFKENPPEIYDFGTRVRSKVIWQPKAIWPGTSGSVADKHLLC